MERPAQFKTLAALWLVLAVVGVIFVIVDLIRTVGEPDGVTPSGLVASFFLAAIAVAAALGLLFRKRWGRPLAILLSAIALIFLVSTSIATLVNIGWDVFVGFTLLIVATVLVSTYGLWLLAPGKGREAYEEDLRAADGA